MDMKEALARLLEGAIGEYSTSRFPLTAWKTPLIGYAGTDDPLFADLRYCAHQGHVLPGDLLVGAKTVIVYFIPFADDIISGNVHGELPSLAWAAAYQETNELIGLINASLESFLAAKGYRACTIAPTHNFDPESLLSPWSHRHAGYIAGLGTFGLNRMLITETGCAGRLGSMVTDLEIAPGERATTDFCLYLNNGSCSLCLERCPAGALDYDGFDRHACYEHLLKNEQELRLKGHADVCGKCCCGLPCSSGNPVK